MRNDQAELSQKFAFRTNEAPLRPLVMATTRMGAGLQHTTVTATVTSRRDPLTTNMANDNAKTMATNPTSVVVHNSDHNCVMVAIVDY